jgi:hypothetical protein
MNVATRKQNAGRNYQIVNIYVGGKPNPRRRWPILQAWREVVIWFVGGAVIALGIARLLA